MILSRLPEDDNVKKKIRDDIYKATELETFYNVFILMHNKEVWHSRYRVTPLYYNIDEEGVIVS